MMQNDDHTKKKSSVVGHDRLTVTLAPGQRRTLNQFAKKNSTTLAFVVRLALNHFIKEHGGRQGQFDFRDFS